MKWQGRQRSSNIEDRRTPSRGGGMFGGNRGMGGGGFNPFGSGGGPRIQLPSGKGGGIGGLGIIIVVVIIGMSLFGINPMSLLEGTIGQGTSTTSADSRPLPEAGQDELADFVAVVTKETENLWTEVFAQNGSTYEPPVVVLFTDQTTSDCGVAQAASGPFYCPIDRRVYIDLAFYDQLRRQFGAPGDFAQAYVIAHEIGHHVQNLTGVLPEFNERRPTMSEAEVNAYSVRVELQADCYAGVWANYANQQNLLDQGDTEEAINAANAIGDDTLTRGQVSPRNFTHGTSEQRMAWLRKGMTTGDVGQCDTFAVAQP